MEELATRGFKSLRNLFEDLVWRRFFEDIGLDEPDLARYVSEVLAEFSTNDSVYRIRNAAGRPLVQVAEMLIASNPMLDANSFDRERTMRKHVGDFTLFMSGLFPENVLRPRQQTDGQIDSFVDFIQAGKESYAIVSCFDQWEYRDEAPLFRRLSDNFELCVAGLNFVKHDLEEFQRDSQQRHPQPIEEAADIEP